MINPAIRLLVVADDEGEYLLTRDLLTETSNGAYTLDWARTYEAGVVAGREQRHDLYLIDDRLGADSGLDLLRVLLQEGCQAPIILLSGQGGSAVDQAALQAGAADYLVKGEITAATLERALRHALERARVLAERAEADAALRQSGERFRALSDYATDLVSVISAEGLLQYASPSYQRILGHAPQNVVGQRVETTVHPDDQARVRELLAGEGPLQAEFRMRHFDGSWRQMEATAVNRVTDPAVGGIIATMRDMTVRAQAEAAQRASEERYRSLVEVSPDAIALLDLQGRLQMANQQAATLYHHADPQALLGRHALELLVPADRARAAAALAAVAAGTDLGLNIYTGQRQDGTTFTLELRSTRIAAQGSPEGDSIMIVARDVTARTQAAEQLRFQARLLETVGQAIIATDVAGVITYWNRAAEELYGWAAVEAQGRNILSILPPEPFRARDVESLASLARGERGGSSSHEYLARHRSSHAIPVLATAVPVQDEGGAVVGIIGVSTDISARVQAEEALRASEERYRTLVEHLPTVTYLVAPGAEGMSLYLSPQIERLMGFTVAEWSADPLFWTTRLHPDDRARALELSAQFDTTGEPLHMQCRLLTRDGQVVWVQEEAVLVRDAAGQPLYTLGIMLDITARMRAEEERERFFTLSQDLMGVFGLDGYFKDVNPACERTLGFAPEELRAEPFLHFVHPDDRAATLAEVATLTLGVTTLSFENRYRCKDGTYRWLLWNAVPVPAEGVIYATARDITERRKMEERQRQHIARLSALHAIDAAIAASLDLRVTLAVVLEQVCLQLGVDAAQVLVLDEHTLILEGTATRGFQGYAAQSPHLRLGQGHAGRAALERRLIVISDLAREEGARVPLVANERFVAYAAAPLIAKGQVQGVLEVFHRAPLEQDAGWTDFLLTLAGQTAIAIDNAQLYQGLQRSNTELRLAYDATIDGWSRALDLRDKETEGHSQRVTALSLRLAQALGVAGEELAQMRRGALLHDIGKMGVPDAVLLKPGPLSEEEWVIMRRHPAAAYDLLAPVPYLRPALDIPYCHHEKWDGTGYPRCLRAEQIPLAARIFAVADVYDALSSDRPYRSAWPAERVRAHLASLSGTHFDPAVVDAFLHLLEEVGT